MSLVKLPFLLASSISWHLALWCPPVPDPGDKILVTSLRERFWKYVALPSNLFLKSTTWLVTIAESLVIINAQLQDVPRSSSHVLSTLLSALGPANASKLTPSSVLGTLLITAGGLTRVLCYRALGPMFTFEQCIRKDHRLVTTGPYAVVRHPSYTGLVMCIVGSCVLHGSTDAWLRASGVLSVGNGGGGLTVGWVRPVFGVWCAVMGASFVTLFRRVTDEDEMLRERFGEEWEAWARRVRYKFVPFVY